MEARSVLTSAKRMSGIPFSGIRKVFERVGELEKQGKPVINLSLGRPDFDTPIHIKEAAKLALDQGKVHYTSNYGLESLREAIALKMVKDNGVPANARNVIVTTGANEAIFLAMMAFLDPGSEVLIPDPAWPHYEYCAHLAGARPVHMPLPWKGQPFDLALIESLVTPRTRMLVLNSPHNPTGSVLDKRALQELASLAIRRDLLVLADEIYEKLVYDDATHVSVASLPGMWPRTITVNGFSKAYAMTGWRLGYVVADERFISAMIRVHQYTVTCATSFAQYGAVAAITGPQQCVADMRREFDRRRRVLLDAFAVDTSVSVIKPSGAFYCMLDIGGLGMGSAHAASFFLNEAGVAMVPGLVFGPRGEGYLRLAYSNSLDNVVEAARRILVAAERAPGTPMAAREDPQQ